MKGMKFSFKKIFGGKKSDGTSLTNASKSEKEGHKNTLERIREMEELLQRKQTFLESKIGEQVTEARKCGKANKRGVISRNFTNMRDHLAFYMIKQNFKIICT